MTTAKSVGNTTLAPPVSLLSDELCKIRCSRSGCSHIIQPPTVNGPRVAQDVVNGQGFLCPYVRTGKSRNSGGGVAHKIGWPAESGRLPTGRDGVTERGPIHFLL